MSKPPTERAVRRSGVIRLLLVAVVLASTGAVLGLWPTASSSSFPTALAKPTCGPGALKETSIDGRVPTADYASGRYRSGYRCNTSQVAHQGATGGFKVERYVDSTGRVCAFYDSTLFFPKDTLMQAAKGLGVVVLDMSNPAQPVKTAELTSPAMLSPHESLLVNQERGILAAELGNAATYPTVLDLYDVKTDCRHPKLLSSSPTGGTGHESGFAPDGRTFYLSGAAGNTLQAMDITDPTKPTVIWSQQGVNYHGVRLSDDGRTMYVANIGNSSSSGSVFAAADCGSSTSARSRTGSRTPRCRCCPRSTGREHSIPQANEPFTRDGRHYVLEFDEFANVTRGGCSGGVSSPVGAARIIDVEDPEAPERRLEHPAGRAPARRPDRCRDRPTRVREPRPGVRRALLLHAHPERTPTWSPAR